MISVYKAPIIVGANGTLAISGLFSEAPLVMKVAAATEVRIEREGGIVEVSTRDDPCPVFLDVQRGWRAKITLLCSEVLIGGKMPDLRTVDDMTVRQLLAEANKRLQQRQG